MNNVLEAIHNRRSVRLFKPEQISRGELEAIVDAGLWAPSSHNTQPWHFIVVKSDETRQKIADVSHNQQWMNSAPVFIACVADIVFQRCSSRVN